MPYQSRHSSDRTGPRIIAIAAFVCLNVALAGCGNLERSKTEPYYAETTPPRKQEFRWSNGKIPKSLDPALAAAPPETDLVRAVFEGLTELDPRTLEAMPAAAESWTSSEDHRVWTFYLRADARWSNGEPVTAGHFVRSWRRLGEIGDKAAHPELLRNIVGFPIALEKIRPPALDILSSPEPVPPPIKRPAESPRANSNTSPPPSGPAPTTFGVTAPDARTLQVLLITGDKDLPKLVAHPMFRPVFDGRDLRSTTTDVVTNGTFRITDVGPGGITLERSDSHWNRDSVKLERVTFVATENAEQALAAYRSGEIDAVTNASFEPLALKLLEPFEDFRRRTHAAINLYDINHEKAPFSNRNVRQALAIAIDRERLTEGEMEGQTQPALSFLPFSRNPEAKIIQDKERARDLLEEAGFPGGEKFPVVRLVINRNDTQQRIARAVARMWKQNLNIETEVIVKDPAELDAVRSAGEYDLIRRNTVFPTADELMSILAILEPPRPTEPEKSVGAGAAGVEVDAKPPVRRGVRSTAGDPTDMTVTEADAVYELWAVPLYFPTSYSLVKPYVSGFDTNPLDAPLLQNVSIDSNWQPK